MRRKKSYRKHARHVKRHKRAKARRNPFFGRKRAHKRAPKRRTRRNPALGRKLGLDKAFLVKALAGGAGFVAAIKGTKYLYNIPGLASVQKYIGLAHVLIGGFLAYKLKKPALQAAAAGIAAAGVVDLAAKNLPLGIPSLLGMDVQNALGVDHANMLGMSYDGDENVSPYVPVYHGEEVEGDSSFDSSY